MTPRQETMRYGAQLMQMMIIEADSAQTPHMTEPLMLDFDAAVHYRVAMAPEEPPQSAGVDRYATG